MHVVCANTFGAIVLKPRFKIDAVIMIICSIVIIFLFTSFIRIHWYTVPPTFQFTVWEDGFDYIVFLQMGILNMIQHFMHKY